MEREEVRKEILGINSKAILCELPTSFGKSKIGIELALMRNPTHILIVVPRLVLIDNWKEEFIEWGFKDELSKVKFSTYMGLHKYKNEEMECVIFDEVQHLSQRCMDIVSTMTIHHVILLSATITRDMKYELRNLFPGLYIYTVKMKEAIDNEILPDPRVFLVPLSLDNTYQSEKIVKHKSGKVKVTCDYKDRWDYLRNKNICLTVRCTQLQKSVEMDNEITFWKDRYMRTRNEIFKNRWLHLAGERLKWLSNLKNPIIYNMLSSLRGERVLTFCNSIDQTIELGRNCINSKNKDAVKVLESFNKGEINHITACNMLNEGMNLVNCRVGIYANLNSSEIIIKQRLGRILRHKNPVIIIPYYKGTREEELVQKMLEDYNPELIKVINNITDIKL